MEAKTFRDAFAVLQEHAETLREQTEPNIDDLLSIVTESVAAYKVCKQRIDAVDKALQEALTDVGGEVGSRAQAGPSDDEDDARPAPSAGRRPAGRPAPKPNPPSATSFDNMDDDIPF